MDDRHHDGLDRDYVLAFERAIREIVAAQYEEGLRRLEARERAFDTMLLHAFQECADDEVQSLERQWALT